MWMWIRSVFSRPIPFARSGGSAIRKDRYAENPPKKLGFLGFFWPSQVQKGVVSPAYRVLDIADLAGAGQVMTVASAMSF